MNSRSIRVFFASALGAGIGTLIALSLGAWLWWVGLMVGGLVGYLSYDWRQIASAIPRAYRFARGWQPSPSFGKLLWADTAYIAFVISWSWVMVSPLIMVLTDANAANPESWMERVVIMAGAFVASMPVAFAAVLFRAALLKEADIRAELDLTMPPRELWRYSPPAVLWRFVVRFPGYVLAAARFLARFAWKLFVLVHSEARLICGVDALIGATIGYLAGSVPIGVAAGGLLGLANYEIVTRRWLIPAGHLVPVPVEDKVD